jgi:hypothetical protein
MDAMRYRESGQGRHCVSLANHPEALFSTSGNFIGFENKALRGFVSQKPVSKRVDSRPPVET